MIQSLSRRYANAFVEALGEQGCLDLLKRKQEIKECFDNQDFQDLIKNPFIGDKEKWNVLEEILSIPEGSVKNAILVLASSKRLELLLEVLEEIECIMMKREQKYYATIFFNRRPSNEEMSIFKEKLAQKIGYEIELKEEIWDQEGIKCYVEGLDLEISFSSQSFIKNLESFILDTFKKGV